MNVPVVLHILDKEIIVPLKSLKNSFIYGLYEMNDEAPKLDKSGYIILNMTEVLGAENTYHIYKGVDLLDEYMKKTSVEDIIKYFKDIWQDLDSLKQIISYLEIELEPSDLDKEYKIGDEVVSEFDYCRLQVAKDLEKDMMENVKTALEYANKDRYMHRGDEDNVNARIAQILDFDDDPVWKIFKALGKPIQKNTIADLFDRKDGVNPLTLCNWECLPHLAPIGEKVFEQIYEAAPEWADWKEREEFNKMARELVAKEA